LRHHAFVSRDDERDHVNPVCARQHVLDETLMTRNVYEADGEVSQSKLGEAQINRNPAPLLFRQTIRVHARQRTHKRSFPVIYMTGSADNN
jgi:hypothetical protein